LPFQKKTKQLTPSIFFSPHTITRRRARLLTSLLLFANDLAELRKEDLAGIAIADDIIVLCNKYQVPIPDDSALNAAGNTGGAQPTMIISATPDKSNRKLDPTTAAISSAAVSEDSNINDSTTNNNNNNAKNSIDKLEVKIDDGDIGGGGDKEPISRNGEPVSRGVTETNVTRYVEGGTSNMNATQNTGQGGGATFAATVASAISRKTANMAQHTTRSINMNRAVNNMLSEHLTKVYNDLVADRRVWAAYIEMKWFCVQPVGEKQVRYHRVLGIGAFGTVNGCVVSTVGTMLAMKSMMKKRIKAKRAKNQVIAEREALTALAINPSPYALRLRYAYASKDAYHFILPLAIGGDLKFHLQNMNGGFGHHRAKVYAAEVALGLGHLHSLGMINRDLKPRNILLSSAGRCQISDFGLAVSVPDGKTVKGRAGTEGYWSPEVINNHPYSYDCDWWSYGVCIFEFIAGFSPFSTKHTGLKTRNDGTRKGEIKFPDGFDESAKALILGLLAKNVQDRVGCQGQGVNEIFDVKYEYFKSLDLGSIRRCEHKTPWLPEKGHIYAAPQGEIRENDEENNDKIKIEPADEIDFPTFMIEDDHQRDIIKILTISKKNNRISVAPPTFHDKSGGGAGGAGDVVDGDGEGDKSGSGGCCVVT
jgi:serine/threonine protein kinase